MRKNIKQVAAGILAACVVMAVPLGINMAAESARKVMPVEETETSETEVPETETSETEVPEPDIPDVVIVAEITSDGKFDYRTCVDDGMKAQLRIKLKDADSGEWLDPGDFEGISYKVTVKNTDIFRIDDGGEHDYQKGEPFTYILSKDAAELSIAGVGVTEYEIWLTKGEECSETSVKGTVEVKNSGLMESDYYIQIDGNENDKKYGLGEWKEYLGERGGWLCVNFQIMLSDSGKKYFDDITAEWTDRDGVASIYSGIDGLKKGGYGRFKLWAEKSGVGASTKNPDGDEYLFEVNVDMDAPVLVGISTESKCYEPTKTDTEQYFPEDFVLKGSFEDKAVSGSGVSGIKKVEYTSDAAAEKAEWVEVENRETDGFSISFPDGIYGAIAVRATDLAGNVSETAGFVNGDGSYIKVVVDKSEPVISVGGVSDGKDYSGEGDNWTNKDVTLDIAIDKESCRYAGIYKCEYVYDRIGDAVNRPEAEDLTAVLPEKWVEIAPSVGKSGYESIRVAEDRNGYYYFRAVSKSGVSSKTAVKRRVLLQREPAKIKPVLVDCTDASRRKDEWYNKASGVPVVKFEYPDYDTGVVSGEYDAPVTIHYRLETKEGDSEDDAKERTASLGIMRSADVSPDKDGVLRFVLTEENLENHAVNFGRDKDTGEAPDGIYTLEYWVTDRAGNISETQTHEYKIDCKAPTDLDVRLAGSKFEVGEATDIVYTRFFNGSVSGSASAEYGISGKGSLTVSKAKSVGEWKDGADGVSDNGAISIAPNKRCFLYVRAEDGAGNFSEGWTMGIVADNMAPSGAGGKEFIIEPEGANRNGFFNRDVRVEISVKDSPEGDDCAGLRAVTANVGKDGEATVSGREMFSFTKDSPTDDEIRAASSFEDFLTVSASANESNDAYVEVTATDRSGNSATSVQHLKIDVTPPKLDISFDNNDASADGSFYRAARTADIHVSDINFDASAVDIRVTRDGVKYEYTLSEWTSDGADHHAFIKFEQDGEYAIEAECVDLADNKSETVKPDVFTIDTTAPVLTLGINSDRIQERREGYFNGVVTALVTVRERNFDPDGLLLEAPASSMGAWSHDGDVHTMSVMFDGDGTYDISCVYTDMARNVSEKAQQQFVVDTQVPQISIDGIEDGAAINGDILPVVTVFDLNMEAEDIAMTLSTGTGEAVDIAQEAATVDVNGVKGYSFTLNDINGRPDNIYYLTVTAHDSAGNESSLTHRFSLNRNGSAYDLAQLVELMGRHYIRYAGLEDIRIVEMNIDAVDEFAIYVSRNGELGYSAAYDKEVSGSADTGYTYIYSIKSDNFKEEGTYKLTLYSRDRAGNEINNKKDINGNEILFIIDNTAPKVVIDGVETGMLYDVVSQEVNVSVTDNFKLSEAEFMLVNRAGDVLKSWDYMASCEEGAQMTFALPQYNGGMSLLYRVKDAAGNEVETFRDEQTALADIPVTTENLAQLADKPAKTKTGSALPAIAGGTFVSAASAFIKRRWKRS